MFSLSRIFAKLVCLCREGKNLLFSFSFFSSVVLLVWYFISYLASAKSEKKYSVWREKVYSQKKVYFWHEMFVDTEFKNLMHHHTDKLFIYVERVFGFFFVRSCLRLLIHTIVKYFTLCRFNCFPSSIQEFKHINGSIELIFRKKDLNEG